LSDIEDMGDRTDALLLRDSAADPSAFGELYLRHVEAVYRWFRRRIEWAASGLTAETFARAWLVRSRFRDERGGSALPWLLGIAAPREALARELALLGDAWFPAGFVLVQVTGVHCAQDVF
jgi:hypothetical protein